MKNYVTYKGSLYQKVADTELPPIDRKQITRLARGIYYAAIWDICVREDKYSTEEFNPQRLDEVIDFFGRDARHDVEALKRAAEKDPELVAEYMHGIPGSIYHHLDKLSGSIAKKMLEDLARINKKDQDAT